MASQKKECCPEKRQESGRGGKTQTYDRTPAEIDADGLRETGRQSSQEPRWLS